MTGLSVELFRPLAGNNAVKFNPLQGALSANNEDPIKSGNYLLHSAAAQPLGPNTNLRTFGAKGLCHV